MLQNRLAQLREERAENDKGFTLIELLVVVVIIGILIAIAIPLYLNYEKGASNKSAAADTRNAVAAVEQCFADNNTYPATGSVANDAMTFASCDQKANITNGNTMTYLFVAATATVPVHYTITTAAGGSGDKTYVYDSSTGQTAAS